MHIYQAQGYSEFDSIPLSESSLSADDLLNYALKGAGIPFDPFSLPTSSVVAEYLPTNPIKTGSLIQREYGLRNIIDVSPVTVSTLNTLPISNFQFQNSKDARNTSQIEPERRERTNRERHSTKLCEKSKERRKFCQDEPDVPAGDRARPGRRRGRSCGPGRGERQPAADPRGRQLVAVVDDEHAVHACGLDGSADAGDLRRGDAEEDPVLHQPQAAGTQIGICKLKLWKELAQPVAFSAFL